MSHLRRAIELSRLALVNKSLTPFGAVLVVGNEIVGEGTSQVMADHDPTAHAEVMALRNAGQNLQTHLFPTATMYCSGEPCPLCLAACLWAQVPRIIFAASTTDIAMHGFEDMQFYRELALPLELRSVQEISAGGAENLEAVSVLTEWVQSVHGGAVVPKL